MKSMHSGRGGILEFSTRSKRLTTLQATQKEKDFNVNRNANHSTLKWAKHSEKEKKIHTANTFTESWPTSLEIRTMKTKSTMKYLY